MANLRLRNNIDLDDMQLGKDGKRLTGRQMLRMFYDTLDMSHAGGKHFLFETVWTIQLQGNDPGNLEKFLNKWDEALYNLDGQSLPDDALLAVFLRQLEAKKALPDDLAYFNRLEDPHPDRSYQWLHKRVVQHVERHRSAVNLASYRKAHDGSAMPAGGDTRGRGGKRGGRGGRKADGKGDGRGQGG